MTVEEYDVTYVDIDTISVLIMALSAPATSNVWVATVAPI